MNRRMITYTLGWVLISEAVAMIVPLICALIYREPLILLFLSCMALCVAFGLLLAWKKPKSTAMYAKESFIIVSFSWIIISLFGALPFVLSGYIPHFIDALFETTSGFTTTGASILKDIEALPHALLLWRSFTHWIGGMGVLVLLVALLPLDGGSNNMYLIKAESPGPSVSKLVPKVNATAKILYSIYAGLTGLEVVFLLFGRVSLFESLNLAFSTAGTGGFAIRNAGASVYSDYVQVVLIVFMIAFGVNFSLYYLLLLRRFKDVWRSEELRAYLAIIIGAAALICWNSYSAFGGLFSAMKHSLFQVASFITTTGFATVDFNQWPEFSKTVMFCLYFCGACAGSTGGGIKVSRIVVLLKSVVKELKIAAHPKRVYKITIDSRPVAHETVRSINVFIMSYAVIFLISLLIISFDNFSFATNITSVATCIGNVGPGFDSVGPTENFSLFSPLSKGVLVLDMIIGRLEIFPVLALFSPTTWKK